jgi:hypothetical protein
MPYYYIKFVPEGEPDKAPLMVLRLNGRQSDGLIAARRRRSERLNGGPVDMHHSTKLQWDTYVANGPPKRARILKPAPVVTAEFVRRLLHYAPDTGHFTWRERSGPEGVGTARRELTFNTRFAGKRAGYIKTAERTYWTQWREIWLLRSPLPVDRLAFLYMLGADGDLFSTAPRYVLHLDGNNLEDRWDNLQASHTPIPKPARERPPLPPFIKPPTRRGTK